LKHTNQSIGKWGEDIAVKYLNQNGIEVLEYGEIDIVARQSDTTIFVEVKTRTTSWMGLPEESINTKKREHMIACAEHYAALHEIDHWQINVISIEGKPGSNPTITHFENAL